MKKELLAFSFLALFACSNPNKTDQNIAFNEEELFQSAKTIFKPIPESANSEFNPLNDAKVELGKLLFFDTRLSLTGNNSCNSCHNLNMYGVDRLQTSPGDNGELGKRNSPTVLNAALHNMQFWDGRAKTVEDQAGGPILNPKEMNMPSETAVVERINKVEIYRELFKTAFPNEKNPITFSNITKAIAAFERTLLTPAPFDEYLKGNQDALTNIQKEGLHLFIESGCTACHNGPTLGGTMMQKFGLFGSYVNYTNSKTHDKGKAELTGNVADEDVFKVPSLRNITQTYPYFHDGSVDKLEDAITIMGKSQLNKEFSKNQIDAMVEFLAALTGTIPRID